jgi:hypothetical protein
MSATAVHRSAWNRLLTTVKRPTTPSTYNCGRDEGDVCQVVDVFPEVWNPFDAPNDGNCGCDDQAHDGEDPRRESQRKLLRQSVNAVAEEGLYRVRGASYSQLCTPDLNRRSKEAITNHACRVEAPRRVLQQGDLSGVIHCDVVEEPPDAEL